MPREILHAVWVATLNRRGQETQTASVTRRKSNLPRFSLRPPGFVVVVVIVAAATLLLLLLLLLLLSPLFFYIFISLFPLQVNSSSVSLISVSFDVWVPRED